MTTIWPQLTITVDMTGDNNDTTLSAEQRRAELEQAGQGAEWRIREWLEQSGLVVQITREID